MQRIEYILEQTVAEAAKRLWNADIDPEKVQVQKTRQEFEGNFTVVVFPLVKISRSAPEATGQALGDYLVSHLNYVKEYNVIKGFLNLSLTGGYWISFLEEAVSDQHYGLKKEEENAPLEVVEFSSPNTNKPLHLGHIRNNLLGSSVSRILEAAGSKVVKVNLVNDRGIHICKSMLAWKKWGKGETPESSGLKGDHLVGKYYVLFDTRYKREIEEMKARGKDPKEAEATAPILEEAREMLRKWEAGDSEVTRLWQTMNDWVYQGFEETYNRLGIQFDKTYYESETYKLGKNIVLQGLEQGILEKEPDGSVWADFTDRKLDRKLLLRSDGTSVYMTQDIGTAHQRYNEFEFDHHVYVVGNEQNYHFQVLSMVLDKLGFDWADRLYHLSYGMVELPEGKMKSREGTVVDADDLVDEMVATARRMSAELGKLEDYGDEEKEKIYQQIGLAALKYFILKVDPKKNMTFNPAESIDFNGNTGPFIQYTYARIRSVLRKAGEQKTDIAGIEPIEKELDVIRLLYDFPEIVTQSASAYNPSYLANYLYDLAKEFNQFYHDHSILSAESDLLVSYRLLLTRIAGDTIQKGMELLGIEVPERM